MAKLWLRREILSRNSGAGLSGVCAKNRTWDLSITVPRSKYAFLVRVPRIERGTSPLSVECSNQLSYTRDCLAFRI